MGTRTLGGITVEVADVPAKAIGPDATEEELALLRGRVVLVEPGILAVFETPVVTPFSVTQLFHRVQALGQEQRSLCIIADLREGGRPDAATREALRAHMASGTLAPDDIFFVVGNNVLMKVFFRFVLAIRRDIRAHLVDSLDDAIERARASRARALGASHGA